MNIYEAYQALLEGHGILSSSDDIIISTNEPFLNRRRFYKSECVNIRIWRREINEENTLSSRLVRVLFEELEEVCLASFESKFESFPMENLLDKLKELSNRKPVEKDE